MTREEAIKILKSKMDGHTDTSYEWVETVRMAIKALELEPCEDAVSRQTVMKLLNEGWWKGVYPSRSIAELPSVTPQQKMGRWTHDGSHWENRWICSECGYKLIDVQTNYCPNCGANMSEISIRAESEEV